MRTLLLALLLLPSLAAAQTRPFSCYGAAQLEDDVFAVPFARGSDRLAEAARTGLDSAAALLREQPDRHACVLGHADRGQGAQTSIELAARRARAVAQALSGRGVERDRIRAEARVGAFSGRGNEPGARAVTIVVMPADPAAGDTRR
jgi:outer membrane protein OmpA-like peptidoglycan-associated protein